MEYSRIDIIGQNGNDGCHYSNFDIIKSFTGFIEKCELCQGDKAFLYEVLNELKERDRLISILRSDFKRLQELHWENIKG